MGLSEIPQHDNKYQNYLRLQGPLSLIFQLFKNLNVLNISGLLNILGGIKMLNSRGLVFLLCQFVQVIDFNLENIVMACLSFDIKL